MKRAGLIGLFLLLAVVAYGSIFFESSNCLWDNEIGVSDADDVSGVVNSLDDIFTKPEALNNMTPDQIRSLAQKQGWDIGTLGKGSQKGQGLIIRQLNEYGNPTDKMIQWHPGGGHHGPQPYWKVSSGTTGTIRIGPQFE